MIMHQHYWMTLAAMCNTGMSNTHNPLIQLHIETPIHKQYNYPDTTIK